jgi:hypothetical protein
MHSVHLQDCPKCNSFSFVQNFRLNIFPEIQGKCLYWMFIKIFKKETSHTLKIEWHIVNTTVPKGETTK